jgi:hypothetical protein
MEASTQISRKGLGGQEMCGRIRIPVDFFGEDNV